MSDADQTRVFLSYRRSDTKALSRLIYESLASYFGEERVFFDIDNIPIGVDFHDHLSEQVAKCTVLLAVIGDRWGAGDVFDDADFVRIEVRSALALGIPVVPLFAEGARPPPLSSVPADLQPLLRRNGLSVDSGRDFRNHMELVVTHVERLSKQHVARIDKERAAQQAEAGRLAKLEAARAAQQAEAVRVAQQAEVVRAAQQAEAAQAAQQAEAVRVAQQAEVVRAARQAEAVRAAQQAEAAQAAQQAEAERFAKLEADRVAGRAGAAHAARGRELRAKEFEDFAALVRGRSVAEPTRAKSFDVPAPTASTRSAGEQISNAVSLEPVAFPQGHAQLPSRRRLLTFGLPVGVVAFGAVFGLSAVFGLGAARSATLEIRAAGVDGKPVPTFSARIDAQHGCSASPCTIGVPVGRHVVAVVANGYVNRTVTVDVTEEKQVFDVSLDPTPAQVRFKAAAPGLTVSVDGKALGALPTAQSLPPGEHVIRMEREGFATVEERIVLSPGQVFDLEPKPPAKSLRATITLGTNASGAKIEAIAGTTRKTLEGPPYALDVDPSSEIKIVASKPGFKDVELNLAFAPNETEHDFVINFGPVADASHSSLGRLGGDAAKPTPKVRMGATTVSGRLPPEVIQRIVRQNYGRFRMCYEQGLARDPKLEGRVSARFVIGRDGAVSSVGNAGSDLPDSGVISCVLSAFYGLSFPQPEGGIVTVVYPIQLVPG